MATIGFLGFGEAGSTLAKGLIAAGCRDLVAYDIAWQTSKLVVERIDETGVELLPSARALAERADIIVSAVVCTEAEAGARSVLPGLTDRHWFLDINSVAPGVKRTIAGLMADKEARYVDVAVMANITSDFSRLPMLVAGAQAAAMPSMLTDAGMRFIIVGEEPGAAAHIKLCRSLLVKGFEALALEAMLASYSTGIHEVVLDSIDESFGDMSIGDMVRHLLGRHAVHGERRAHELREVSIALRDVGVEPLLADAGFERMARGVNRGLQRHFNGRTDPVWTDVLETLHRLVVDDVGVDLV